MLDAALRAQGGAVGFAQNQRDEVRLIGGDGRVTGALSAARFSTHKQETLLCVGDCNANASIDVDLSPTIKVGGGPDIHRAL